MRYRISTQSGEIRQIQGHASFVGTGRSGHPRRITGVSIDVTRETDLMAQIKLNGAALDSTVCGVVIAKAQGSQPIVYVNRAFTEITGFRADDVLGRNCRFLNEGLKHQPELDQIRRTLAKGESCVVTLQNRRKCGTLFWNTLRISPIRDDFGSITHFIGIQDDVTEQIKARQIIAEGRDQLEAIISAAPDAIISVDSRQQIVNFNAAAVRLFGWSRDEILGRSVHELVPTHARGAHVELVRDYIDDRHSAPGSIPFQRIVQARHKDGTSFPALVSLARHQIGGTPMVTAIAHDMSEIVKANDQLQRLSEKLSEQLTEARRANEAKDQFVAHMSHELRTPLNAIIGLADMVATLGADKFGPERTTEYVSDIQRSGKHLLSLINDILNFSKLQAGKETPLIAAVDARAVIEEALTTIGPVLAEKRIRIQVEISGSATVLCDRRFTLQCLLNLLSNAAKYAPEASLVVARQQAIDGGVRFSIEDEGAGLPNSVLQRIREPFLRHEYPLISNEGGAGLGLAITKQLVEKQGGRLRIDLSEKGGTVASIWLPVQSGASEPNKNDASLPKVANLEVC